MAFFSSQPSFDCTVETSGNDRADHISPRGSRDTIFRLAMASLVSDQSCGETRANRSRRLRWRHGVIPVLYSGDPLVAGDDFDRSCSDLANLEMGWAPAVWSNSQDCASVAKISPDKSVRTTRFGFKKRYRYAVAILRIKSSCSVGLSAPMVNASRTPSDNA
jgi:hypothetical protein